MSKIIHSDDLSLSREMLARRTPVAPRLTIWLVVAFIMGAIIWVNIAPMEEVINATGSIRPLTNVSLVRNIVPGRILGISYKPGQQVMAGQELLSIDTAPLRAQMSSLDAQIQEDQIRLEGVESLVVSLRQRVNRLSRSQDTAWVRYEAWSVEDRRLELQARSDQRLWEEEKRVPESGTTSSRIRDLEMKMRTSQLLWEKNTLDLQQQLLSERDSLSLELKRLKSQTDQVRSLINNAKIFSPLDGIVQEVSSLNSGDYLQADQNILRVVPSGREELRIAIQVPARLAGRLAVGNRVKLRFPSFPFNEYGGAEGVVLTIDPDSTIPQSQNGEVYFTILSNLDRTELSNHRGTRYPLKVGLQVNAKFVFGSKPIIQYLLETLDLWT